MASSSISFASKFGYSSRLFFGRTQRNRPAANTEASNKMVTIRLQRRGGKKEPFYHVVVTDSRRAGGGSLEQVGFFNPVARGNSQELRLELDRVDYWLGVGAQPSERVQQLIKSYRKTQVAAAA
jgi:small subunit ribosomal protein S16